MTRFALKALSFETFVHRFIVMIAIHDAVSNTSRSSQTILNRIKWNSKPPSPPKQGWSRAKAKTRHFPILDLGGRGVSNFSSILSKIVAAMKPQLCMCCLYIPKGTKTIRISTPGLIGREGRTFVIKRFKWDNGHQKMGCVENQDLPGKKLFA